MWFNLNPSLEFNGMRKFFLLTIVLSLLSCRLPDNFGFYQPITLSLAVPDGPPEYKAGWYNGCRSALGNSVFLNAFTYREDSRPIMGSGVYHHDPQFQTGWGQGWYACVIHIYTFVNTPVAQLGPLE